MCGIASERGRFFWPLLAICFASGCAALIYEVVWLQLLQLALGSTASSLAVLLGTFMGGMCLGSIAFARVAEFGHHPLRVYALIEVGIGTSGLTILWAVPHLDWFYAFMSARVGSGLWLRAIVSSVCLLFPTLLMGATFPAIARWVEMTPVGIRRMGYLYAANIAGAVAGSLSSGFYLLRFYDTAIATFVAVALSTAVALVATSLAAVAPKVVAASHRSLQSLTETGRSESALLIIALSGFCALGAEVVWTRALSLTLGPTVYTFSIIVSVFLVGLGLGSTAAAWCLRRSSKPIVALGYCQIFATVSVAWAAFVISQVLPHIEVRHLIQNLWFKSVFDFSCCLLAMLPAACFWGASFPLALAARASEAKDPASVVGHVYAANAAGAVIGSIAFSLLLIPSAGTQQSQRIMIAVSTVAALVALARHTKLIRLGAQAAVAGLLAWGVPAIPWGVVAFGRELSTSTLTGNLLYLGEGRNASIVVSELNHTRRFHISGKIEASSDQQDMRMQRMLGHIPALLHPKPRSVLVVGCGAGVTAGSFTLYPEVERIVICELEPLVVSAAARYFSVENYNVLRDRRTRVIYDDARHYILTAKEKFDIITCDPIHPWVKGSAALYTVDYFELCKQRLHPGGVLTQWVPLYESTPETVKSEIATFARAFPNATIWANETPFLEGYDVVLLGVEGPVKINVEGLERRLERPEYADVRQSLKEIAFGSTTALLGSYAGRVSELRSWLRGAQINSDHNLRLQYLAGLGPGYQAATLIYDEMLYYRTFPEALFVATPAEKRSLRAAMGFP